MPGVDKRAEATVGATLQYTSGIQERDGQPLKGGMR